MSTSMAQIQEQAINLPLGHLSSTLRLMVNLPLDKHGHDDVDVVIHPYRTDNTGA